MISRRAFLQGLIVTGAGLLVPEPAKIIFDVGKNLSRRPEHFFTVATFDFGCEVGLVCLFEFRGEIYRHAVRAKAEPYLGLGMVSNEQLAEMQKASLIWKEEKIQRLLCA